MRTLCAALTLVAIMAASPVYGFEVFDLPSSLGIPPDYAQSAAVPDPQGTLVFSTDMALPVPYTYGPFSWPGGESSVTVSANVFGPEVVTLTVSGDYGVKYTESGTLAYTTPTRVYTVNYTVTVTIPPVPLPPSVWLTGSGLIGLAMARLRKWRRE
jgi:hypothetical protein